MTMQEALASLNKDCLDWNEPRNRMYIAAKFAAVENELTQAQLDLAIEQEVNRRVTERLR